MSILPAEVRDSDTVLISGPPMSGKYDLFHRLLADWSDAPVVISTGRTAEKVREDHEAITEKPGESVVVIDCVTREQGEDATDTDTTKYVDSPGNLTDIGVKFTNVVEASTGLDRAVGVYSLSQLLMYWEPQRIYQFTRVLASQATGNDWPLVGVVGSTMHDEQVLHTLQEPFDRILETRVDDDREFRLRSRVGPPGDWQSF